MADYGMLLVLVGAVIVLASNPPEWVWWVEAVAIVLTAVMWLVRAPAEERERRALTAEDRAVVLDADRDAALPRV